MILFEVIGSTAVVVNGPLAALHQTVNIRVCSYHFMGHDWEVYTFNSHKLLEKVEQETIIILS